MHVPQSVRAIDLLLKDLEATEVVMDGPDGARLILVACFDLLRALAKAAPRRRSGRDVSTGSDVTGCLLEAPTRRCVRGIVTNTS